MKESTHKEVSINTTLDASLGQVFAAWTNRDEFALHSRLDGLTVDLRPRPRG